MNYEITDCIDAGTEFCHTVPVKRFFGFEGGQVYNFFLSPTKR
jgi:hypothetical protein